MSQGSGDIESNWNMTKLRLAQAAQLSRNCPCRTKTAPRHKRIQNIEHGLRPIIPALYLASKTSLMICQKPSCHLKTSVNTSRTCQISMWVQCCSLHFQFSIFSVEGCLLGDHIWHHLERWALSKRPNFGVC